MRFLIFLSLVIATQSAFARYPDISCSRWDDKAIGYSGSFGNTYLEKIYNFYLQADDSLYVEAGHFNANVGYFQPLEHFNAALEMDGRDVTITAGSLQLIIKLGVSPEKVPRYYGENWGPDARATVGVGY